MRKTCEHCGQKIPEPLMAETAHLNPFNVGDAVFLKEDFHEAPKGTSGRVTMRLGSGGCSVVLGDPSTAYWIKNEYCIPISDGPDAPMCEEHTKAFLATRSGGES